ncbi:hypothetical protein DCAR_0312481 [Daucus carota subsp. sativus]|uniref:Uncharacterized protein n=1 Tax=Daucus carota subsp. sativus TaxID=79200 RepID=A0A166B1N9_DAUCS|nr:hypothetical protein DCAR_0312481 [Daucus carota subsp. sativus]
MTRTRVNTNVDMRFNFKDAHWLSDRVKEGNIEDALGKLQGDILFLHMSKDPIRAGEIVVFNIDVCAIIVLIYFHECIVDS